MVGAFSGNLRPDDDERARAAEYRPRAGSAPHQEAARPALVDARPAWVTSREDLSRPACDLYHSALEVRVPDGRFVIEMTPVPDSNGTRRGLAAVGPVGNRRAGRFRRFRYEIRRWRYPGRRGGHREPPAAVPRSRVRGAAARPGAIRANTGLGS
jgi:hypothetical protein